MTERPAPYSNTDEQETQGVDTFKKLLNHEKVKADIKERDKYPNIDGYLELVDESRVPIGKLEVQVKKLSDNSKNSPKLKCPVSLFSYSETTCNPVLLVGVNVKQNKAYWVHIHKDLINNLANRSDQKTKVVNFPKSNVIDGNDTRYIEEWKNIIEVYKEKIKDYDKLKNSYIELSQKSNPALGSVKKDFQDIHIFLDKINGLLEKKFSIVKKRFYPTSWKIGLAYYEYQNNSVSYTLYPIPFNKNDVQIKKVDKKLHRQLKQGGLVFTGHFMENPIRLRPKEYAREIVESNTLKILENRLLNHKGNVFLAREFIFAFIDKFSQQMGLDKKDKYTLNEIEKAFFQYLPIWVDEAVKFMVKVKRNRVKVPKDCLYRRPYLDPDILIPQIMDDERKEIEESVRARIKQKDSVPRIPLGNDKFPFRIFEEFCSFLKSKGIKEIDRVYLPRDYSRLKENGGLVWNVFSPDVVKRNLKIFYADLQKVYTDTLLQNFPEIIGELPLFGEASRVIIVFSVREEYKSFQDSPGIQFFYLDRKNQNSLEIEIYNEGETKDAPKISQANSKKGVELNGKKYKLISIRAGILDFIYDDLPMFNFVYEILEENLKRYFNNLKRDS